MPSRVTASLRENSFRYRKLGVEILAHTNVLRSLPRENKCKLAILHFPCAPFVDPPLRFSHLMIRFWI